MELAPQSSQLFFQNEKLSRPSTFSHDFLLILGEKPNITDGYRPLHNQDWQTVLWFTENTLASWEGRFQTLIKIFIWGLEKEGYLRTCWQFLIQGQYLPGQLNKKVNQGAHSFSHQSVQFKLLIHKVKNKKNCRYMTEEKCRRIQTETLWRVLILRLRASQRTQTQRLAQQVTLSIMVILRIYQVFPVLRGWKGTS